MSGLVILGFAAAAAVAISSMVATVRRYGGLALAIEGQMLAQARPRYRRSMASRDHVGTPRRALARGRRALGISRRISGSGAAGLREAAVVR